MKYIGENAIKKLISLINGDLAKKQDSITVSGLLKGDGTTISAAVAGTDYMASPTGGTTGQILKKTETGTEWADVPVPDWNQNDETAADYVKNRTHYEKSEYIDYVLNMDGIEIVGFSMPEVGETITVKINGVESAETVKKSRSGVLGDYTYIGTIDFDSLRNAGTGWCVIAVQEGTIGLANPYTTISIDTIVIHKIDLKYLPASFKPDGKSYLTFSSLNSFTLAVSNTTKNWDGTLEYFASDRTWTTWDGTATLFSVDNYGEYVLYLRGTGNSVITGNSANYKWVLSGSDISCIGNIENLLDYATVASGKHPTMAGSCYSNMFRGCTSLTKAPALPATVLADSCYYYMFYNCTNLTQAPPALPATTMAGSCYSNMFQGCTSLTKAPALPATVLADSCYYYMFYNCTNLTQAPPALPATTMADNCYANMFNGCTSLTKAPSLPATTLANYCYANMFRGCTSLTKAPALPATVLADSCYYYMFYNCTNLKLSSVKTDEYTQEYRIPSSDTGTTANNALTNMFTSTGGSFTGSPKINTTYYLSSDNMIVRETEISTLNGYVGSMIKELATQEYVDGKVPDGGSTGQVLTKTADGQEWQDREKDLFVVNMTTNDGSIIASSDKTFDEVQAAYLAGKTVMAYLGLGGNYVVCPLMIYSENISIIFSSASASNGHIASIIMTPQKTTITQFTAQSHITASGLLKGDGSGGVSAATAGTDYIASGNIVKQTLVASETTPTENYAINWVYG